MILSIAERGTTIATGRREQMIAQRICSVSVNGNNQPEVMLENASDGP